MRRARTEYRTAHKPVSLARRGLNYAIPFLEEYDYKGQAREILRKDKDFARQYRQSGGRISDLEAAVQESYEQRKGLLGWVQFADTTDKLTSILGAALEYVAGMVGFGVGAILPNIVEETAEMVLKTPFYAKLAQDSVYRDRIKGLLLREAATYGVPVGGDILFDMRNIYVKTVHDIIRQDAKQRVLSQPQLLTIYPHELRDAR